MPQFDITNFSSQIFWFIICFFTMLLIMWKWIIPMVSEMTIKRQNLIDGDLERAAKLKEQAEKAYEKYEEALKNATEKANKSLEKTQAELKDTISKKQEELSERLNKKILDGEKAIENSKKIALDKMHEISETVAVEIINKINLKTITSKDIKDAIKTIEEQ